MDCKELTSSSKPGAIIVEGHIQGLSNTRSLGKAGIPVFVLDRTNCVAQHSKYCNKFFRCPDFLTDEFIFFLIDLAQHENILGWVLLPSNDHAVYNISKSKDILEQYYKVITPHIDIIERIYDKARLIHLAHNLKIPVPKTQCFSYVHEPISENLRFPVITKGKNGLSFYKAMRVKALVAKNENELRNQLLKIEKEYNVNDTLTQEIIPSSGTNNTISFTAFCDNGSIKTYWTGEKIREHPSRFGTATFAGSTNVPVCLRQSEVLLRVLDYTGVCEIEYLHDPQSGEYKLIEINARTWLWVELAKACGIDYVKMIYNYVNEIPQDYPVKSKLKAYWINPLTDITYSMMHLLVGKLNPVSYIKSLLNKTLINALFKKTDVKPGFVYLLNIFTFLKNR